MVGGSQTHLWVDLMSLYWCLKRENVTGVHDGDRAHNYVCGHMVETWALPQPFQLTRYHGIQTTHEWGLLWWADVLFLVVCVDHHCSGTALGGIEANEQLSLHTDVRVYLCLTFALFFACLIKWNESKFKLSLSRQSLQSLCIGRWWVMEGVRKTEESGMTPQPPVAVTCSSIN